MKIVPIDPRENPKKWEEYIIGKPFAGAGDYVKQLLWTLDQCPETPTNVLEIGLGYGVSALLWLELTNADVTVIELLDESQWRIAEGRECFLTANADSLLKEHGNRFKVIQGRGGTAVWKLSQEYDFIFIDSSHTYEDTKNEIAGCWRVVEPGRIVAGHDISLPGVNRAVTEFAEKLKLVVKSNTEYHDMGTWCVKKEA